MMLRAVQIKSWKQHTLKQQLYSHLPPILKKYPSKISKTNWALMKKQGQTHKQHSFLDSYTFANKQNLTSALHGHCMLG